MSGNPFQDALKGVFGAINVTPLMPNSTVASASGEGAISRDPAWVHGVGATGPNTAVINWRLINASATGVLSPILFNILNLDATTRIIEFPRPLNFDKGIMWQTTASAVGGTQLYVYWEPGPNPLRGN